MPVGGVDTGCLNLETTGTLGYSSIFNSLVPRSGLLNVPFLGLAVGWESWILASALLAKDSLTAAGIGSPPIAVMRPSPSPGRAWRRRATAGATSPSPISSTSWMPRSAWGYALGFAGPRPARVGGDLGSDSGAWSPIADGHWLRRNPKLPAEAGQAGVLIGVDFELAAGGAKSVRFSWPGSRSSTPSGCPRWSASPRYELAFPSRGNSRKLQTTLDGPCYVDMVDRMWRRAGDPAILAEFYLSVKASTLFTVNLRPGSGLPASDPT